MTDLIGTFNNLRSSSHATRILGFSMALNLLFGPIITGIFCALEKTSQKIQNKYTSVLLYEKTFSRITSERFKKFGSSARKIIFVLFAPIVTTIEEVTQSRSMMRASRNVLKIRDWCLIFS